MVPKRSFPAGGSGVAGDPGNPNSQVLSLEDRMQDLTQQQIEVFDMQANRNGWPEARDAPVTGNGWRHSDLREVAYLHTWKAWKQPVTDANRRNWPERN